MMWNRTEILVLAKPTCQLCAGSGIRRRKRLGDDVCPCTLRAVFRQCIRRFRECVASGKLGSAVKVERVSKAVNATRVYGRKNEEYMADFDLIARRTLTEPVELNVYRFHMMLGADWKLCCRRLNISRGDFFHAVYRVQEKLGRAFRETQPYGIFPLNEYFGNISRDERVVAIAVPVTRGDSGPVRPPLQQADLPQAA